MRDSRPNECIAVLGGSGFAGGHITRRLLAEDCEVHVYSRHPEALKISHPRLKLFHVDLRRQKHLQGSGIYDAIVNATGRVAGVGYNAIHQSEMLVANFEAMKSAANIAAGQARYFIQISSACVYANEVSAGAREEQGFIGEPDPANWGYGWGKRMGEVYTKAIMQERRVPFMILRPYNLYGPFDMLNERSHVIPALIQKFARQTEIYVWGDGSQVREFLYVEDFADTVCALIKKKAEGTVNVCRGRENAVTLRELVACLQEIFQSDKRIIFGAEGPTGQLQKFGDATQARRLEILPNTSLQEGLKKTVAWFKNKNAPTKHGLQ
jgi:GDP-L-fucose synthase